LTMPRIAMRDELRSVGAGMNDLLLREFAGSLSAREQAFRAARDRFGEVLRVPGPITETVQGLDGDAYGQVLALYHVYLLTDDLTFPLLATVDHEVLVSNDPSSVPCSTGLKRRVS
jgi:hypothetical protein